MIRLIGSLILILAIMANTLTISVFGDSDTDVSRLQSESTDLPSNVILKNFTGDDNFDSNNQSPDYLSQSRTESNNDSTDNFTSDKDRKNAENETQNSPQEVPAVKSAGHSSLKEANDLIAEGAVEILNKRTEYGKVFFKPDGKFVTLASAEPIHFQDVDSIFQEIDNSIVADESKQGYGFTNKNNSFKIFFPTELNNSSDILLKPKNGTEIKIGKSSQIKNSDKKGSTEIIQTGKNSRASFSDNTVKFENRYDYTDETYTTYWWGLKHNFVINHLPDFLSNNKSSTIAFSEEVTLPEGTFLSIDGAMQSGDFTTDQKIDLLDSSGNSIGFFRSPIGFDSSEKTQIPGSSASINLVFNIEFITKNIVQFSTVVPVNWLTNPERVFPVIIDPTFQLIPDMCCNYPPFLDNEKLYIGRFYDDLLEDSYDSRNYTYWKNIDIEKGVNITDCILSFTPITSYSETLYSEMFFKQIDNDEQILNLLYFVENYNYFYNWVTLTDTQPDIGEYSINWSPDNPVKINLAKDAKKFFGNSNWHHGSGICLKWATTPGHGLNVRMFDNPILSISWTPVVITNGVATSSDGIPIIRSNSVIFSGEIVGLATMNVSIDAFFYYTPQHNTFPIHSGNIKILHSINGTIDEPYVFEINQMNLLPSTRYNFFAAIELNIDGTYCQIKGFSKSFTTLPLVNTLNPVDVFCTGATLRGEVDEIGEVPCLVGFYRALVKSCGNSFQRCTKLSHFRFLFRTHFWSPQSIDEIFSLQYQSHQVSSPVECAPIAA